ncbi:hypothetical protein [Nonomuraea diastatica]|uniref:hypothetical protein n=1 Tax=Nonomuraea diastatica TaxID=1848329 RepID=UPI001FEB2D24|nr:hypothetical protein [Nonomuraea diastatica]
MEQPFGHGGPLPRLPHDGRRPAAPGHDPSGLDPDRAAAAAIVGAVEGCLVQCLADPEFDLGGLAEPIIQICVRSLR